MSPTYHDAIIDKRALASLKPPWLHREGARLRRRSLEWEKKSAKKRQTDGIIPGIIIDAKKAILNQLS